MTLLSGNNPTILKLSKHPGIAVYMFDNRSADENRMIGLWIKPRLFKCRDIQVHLKAIHLAAKSIASHGDVHHPQQRLLAANIFG